MSSLSSWKSAKMSIVSSVPDLGSPRSPRRPLLLVAMAPADLKLPSAHLHHHCASHHSESACASEARPGHKKLVTFCHASKHSVTLWGLHCLLETPAVSAQEVGMSILTMHPGLSMCPLPPCLYHQSRSFLASRRSPFLP